MGFTSCRVFSIIVGIATLNYSYLVEAVHPQALRRRGPVNIPISEVDVPSEHPLARRQSDATINGGPARAYMVQVTVGSSQDAESVLIDTGSADLVVAGFDNDGSISNTDLSCSETYGGNGAKTGSVVQGPYAFDGFQTSGYFCVLALGAINGILGLTYPYKNGGVAGQTGQNPLSQFEGAGLNSFAIYLANRPNGGGVFTPNDYDQQFIDGDAPFVQESVNNFNGGFWGVDMSGSFEYEGNSYDFGNPTAIIDSGTNTINLPPSVASQIWSLTGADSTGSYGNNCNPGGDPVTFISASGNRYDIPAAVYVIQNPSGGCSSAFRAKSTSGTANNPHAIFGAAFIRAYYTYFDIPGYTLNFAPSSG